MAEAIGRAFATGSQVELRDHDRWRLEIQRREAADGSTLTYWNWRRRDSTRQYVYGGTSGTIPQGYEERIKRRPAAKS